MIEQIDKNIDWRLMNFFVMFVDDYWILLCSLMNKMNMKNDCGKTMNNDKLLKCDQMNTFEPHHVDDAKQCLWLRHVQHASFERIRFDDFDFFVFCFLKWNKKQKTKTKNKKQKTKTKSNRTHSTKFCFSHTGSFFSSFESLKDKKLGKKGFDLFYIQFNWVNTKAASASRVSARCSARCSTSFSSTLMRFWSLATVTAWSSRPRCSKNQK